MAGAIKIGFLEPKYAQKTLVKRLSAIPMAHFEIVFALIGATTKTSAQSTRLMCSVLSLGLNCSQQHLLLDNVSKTRGEIKFRAFFVMIVFVLYYDYINF